MASICIFVLDLWVLFCKLLLQTGSHVGLLSLPSASLILSLGYAIYVFRKERKRVKGLVDEYMSSELTDLRKVPKYR